MTTHFYYVMTAILSIIYYYEEEMKHYDDNEMMPRFDNNCYCIVGNHAYNNVINCPDDTKLLPRNTDTDTDTDLWTKMDTRILAAANSASKSDSTFWTSEVTAPGPFAWTWREEG